MNFYIFSNYMLGVSYVMASEAGFFTEITQEMGFISVQLIYTLTVLALILRKGEMERIIYDPIKLFHTMFYFILVAPQINFYLNGTEEHYTKSNIEVLGSTLSINLIGYLSVLTMLTIYRYLFVYAEKEFLRIKVLKSMSELNNINKKNISLIVFLSSLVYLIGSSAELRSMSAIFGSVFRLLVPLFYAGVFIVNYLDIEKRKKIFYNSIFALIALYVSIQNLNKSLFILPVLFYIAARIIGGGSFYGIFKAGIVLFVLISITGNAYLIGRLDNTYDQKDLIGKVSFLIENSNNSTVEIKGYSTFGRLDQTEIQAHAINLYNNGQGANDLKNILWTVVPRILFPDKPSMTESAHKLYYKIRGHSGAAVSIGSFVDGYYNLGYLGVIISAVLYSSFLVISYALIFKSLRFKLLPRLLMIATAGFYSISFSGNIVPSVVGGFIPVIFVYFVTNLMSGFGRKDNERI